MYEKHIANPKIIKPLVNDGNLHVYHLYVVRSEDREIILKKMKK
jgi:hypothetical protein